MIPILLFSLVFLGALVALAWWFGSSFERTLSKRFEEASARAIRENLQAILALAGNALEDKTKHIQKALSVNEESVEKLVTEIQSQVKNFQQEIRSTEQDRTVKFSEILNMTSRLSDSTEKLGRILSTNNLRGQWGERVAEDILKSTGLMEDLHYHKNKQLETSLNRPDFTFLLPDEHKVNMDVKFPIANLVKAQEIEEAGERKRALKDFETDVRNRIREISGKDYINPEENTVDFAVLFVPSESVYAAIHENCPEIFSFAESKRIVLAAPFSLIAILKVILQSFRHFHFERKTRELVTLIEKLADDLERFKGRFEEFDDHIKKIRRAYDEIAQTSFQKIQSKIEQIERYKVGTENAAQVAVHTTTQP